jgi:hypothetical protein
MNMDTLLRQMEEQDRAQRWDTDSRSATAAHGTAYGAVAAVMVLLLLLALWMSSRGDDGPGGLVPAPAAAGQPDNGSTGVTATTNKSGTTTGTATGQSVSSSGHGVTTTDAVVHHRSSGGSRHGSSAGSGSDGSGSGSGGGTGTRNPDAVAFGLNGGNLNGSNGGVRRVDVTSCGPNGSPTGTVTFGNGLVVHNVPVSNGGSTVSVGGVPYNVPAGASYGASRCA